MLPVLRMGVQGPLYWDNSNNMWKLQGKILRVVEYHFFDIYVLNYIFLSSNISISLYITEWKLKNLNKSTVWPQLSLLIESLKKMLRQ
jgi:hypothetical protein